MGGTGARVNIDYYGKATTALVEFLTTAVVDAVVTGYGYLSGTTDGSKIVVDTVTGSTWYLDDFQDGAAGATFSGGSGLAVAAGDLSVIAAGIVVIDAYHDVPTADAVTDAQMRDVIGRKTDTLSTVVVATDSLMSYLKGLITQTPQFLANQTPADMVTNSNYQRADSPITLFTVTGTVKVKVWAHIDNTVLTASNDGTLEIGVVGNIAILAVQDVVTAAEFATGDDWGGTTAAENPGVVMLDWVVLGNGDDIIMTIAGSTDISQGQMTFYCEWLPVVAGSTVVNASLPA